MTSNHHTSLCYGLRTPKVEINSITLVFYVSSSSQKSFRIVGTKLAHTKYYTEVKCTIKISHVDKLPTHGVHVIENQPRVFNSM